jgi:hypothetical protein
MAKAPFFSTLLSGVGIPISGKVFKSNGNLG